MQNYSFNTQCCGINWSRWSTLLMDRGITIWLCHFHFSLPVWLQSRCRLIKLTSHYILLSLVSPAETLDMLVMLTGLDILLLLLHFISLVTSPLPASASTWNTPPEKLWFSHTTTVTSDRNHSQSQLNMSYFLFCLLSCEAGVGFGREGRRLNK